MRAVVLKSYGGPEVLTVTEVPDPDPGPEELLVRVTSTAVNRADLLQRMGLYPEPGPPREHEIPGMEFSGTVVATGARVAEHSVGDAVMGIVSGGSYAERLVVHERQAMPVPSNIDPVDAGGIPEVFITAYDALVLQGGLTAGGWALIHAGASGVGTAAIQLVSAVGGRSIVTCSASKVGACRTLGADVVVDYGSEDFVASVAEATRGAGVDVVLDVIGGDYVPRNLASCRVGGTIMQVGVMGGGKADVPVGDLLRKRIAWIGTTLRSRPHEAKVAVSQRCAHDLVPLFEQEKLRPVIDRRVPLDDIAAAHEYVASNANIGKVLITVDDGGRS